MPTNTMNEQHRLDALSKPKIPDTPPEQECDDPDRLRELLEHPAAHYLIATLIVVTIAVFKGQLDLLIGVESPFVLLFGSILLSAWRGGLGPGLYATALASVISYYYFLSPQGSFTGKSPGQNLRMLLFVCEGTLASMLCSSRLRTEEVIRRARHLLERRVEMRTSELAEMNRFLRAEVNERAALQKDLKEARDAALESVRLKSEFLANMSHEIRTPMNGVVGMTGLLLDTGLDSEQRRYAEIIRSSGESLMTIINDILDFSKIDAGKLELEKLDFDLRDLIESTVELLGERVRDHNNEISALTYADVPSTLRGDPGRLRQVLTNFISNAAKFTRNGQITVRVRKEHETTGRVFLEFSVSDTGVGIPEDVRKRLFQPFTQSDASTTRKFGGTGLGLSISKRLVEMMGGEIGVDSEAGKGSRFWFKIALEKQEESGDVFAGRDSAETTAALHGRRVLVVDDNPVNRKLLAYEFLSWSMDVEQTESGIDAIARISEAEAESRPFDLIVLDMLMPVMNGLETAERIAGIASPVREEFERPPIIMVSSSGARADKTELARLDIHHYLTKPYRREDLLDAVIGSLKIGQAGDAEEVLLRTEAPNRLDEAEGAEFAGFRILLVEDNPVNQMVARTQLEKLGCRADVASNGIEALKALEMMPYDLVLMDCQMPEMDGYQATREIRKRQWAAVAVPVIALTAHAIDGEREKCIDAGMDDYLSKPVGKEQLIAMLRKWLKAAKIPVKTNAAGPASPDILELPSEEPAVSAGYRDELLIMESGSASQPAATPSMDVEVLNDVTGGDPETLVEVLEMYLEQTALYLKDMETAVAESDADALYRAAHKAVGSSSLCGMTAIVGPIRDLERSGRMGDLLNAAGQLAKAKSAFAGIKTECEELLRRQTVGSTS